MAVSLPVFVAGNADKRLENQNGSWSFFPFTCSCHWPQIPHKPFARSQESSRPQLGSDGGHMLALKTRPVQLILTGLPFT